jgi:hypothetical protein
MKLVGWGGRFFTAVHKRPWDTTFGLPGDRLESSIKPSTAIA